jgi:hypothetical protein
MTQSEGYFPPMDKTSEYMVPGPGMSSVHPWLLPPPANPDPSSKPNDGDEYASNDQPVADNGSQEPDRAASVEAPPSETASSEAPAAPEGESDSATLERPAARDSASSNGVRAAGHRQIPNFLGDELGPILASAQEAAAQIVERARAQAGQEFADAQRERRLLDERMAELMSWHDQMKPMVGWFQGKMEEIQARIDELPDLIRTGLDPLATAVSSMDPAFSKMNAAANRLLALSSLRSTSSETKEHSTSS